MADSKAPSNLPDKSPPGRSLDRAALERVLARASELQAGTSDVSESMTEDQLIELGKEVGLSPEHVRQAIAEEHTRVVVQDSNRVSGFFGPTTAWTQRVIAGSQADVLARIDRYMQSEEALGVRRRSQQAQSAPARGGEPRRRTSAGARGSWLGQDARDHVSDRAPAGAGHPAARDLRGDIHEQGRRGDARAHRALAR